MGIFNIRPEKTAMNGRRQFTTRICQFFGNKSANKNKFSSPKTKGVL